MRTAILTFLFVFQAFIINAKGLDDSLKEIKLPPRIIRTCCAFGYDISMVGIPFMKYSDIADRNLVGNHEYLGGRNEGNGILYSYRGGFIDLGHLRDQADWTAFLYHLITTRQADDTIAIKLSYEGGPKNLSIFPPKNMTNDDVIHLAGSIAYDLSVWHEIATWFGVSSVPFYPERYSSFSVEDNYSNMLGITLGMKALQSDLPFEQAMTDCLRNTLDSLQAVPNLEKTLEAMDRVYNDWWTRSYKIPNTNVMLKRNLNINNSDQPALVPGWEPSEGSSTLSIPQLMHDQTKLKSYYSLEFKLNQKFPAKEMFPDRKDHVVNQNDFQTMMGWVVTDLQRRSKPPKISKKEQKKNKDFLLGNSPLKSK